jgi:hypothetical protein
LIRSELREIDKDYLDRLYRFNQLAGCLREIHKAKITGVTAMDSWFLKSRGRSLNAFKEIRFEF